MFQAPIIPPMTSWTQAIPVRWIYYALSMMAAGAATTFIIASRHVMTILKKERQRLAEIDLNVKVIIDNHLTHIQKATEETAAKLDTANQHLAEQSGYLRAIVERHRK